jgi:hypothetical protein
MMRGRTLTFAILKFSKPNKQAQTNDEGVDSQGCRTTYHAHVTVSEPLLAE